MRETCDIKRVPVPVAGKAQDAQAHIGDLRCTPLLPVTAEAAIRAGIESPAGRAAVYLDGDVDVRAGDVLVVSEKDYPIVSVGKYDALAGGRSVIEVIVQTVKTERR